MSGSVRRPPHRQASATTPTLASEDVAMSESSSSAPPRKQGPASVAIDLGSYTIRICITGAEGKPPIITRCPNALVKPSQKRYSGASGSSLLAGPQIKQHCTNFGSLSIRQPMDRGMIIDWPTQKLILDAALVEALSQEMPGSKSDQRLLEGREVIVTEAYLNLPDLQAGLDVLFLEGYGASPIKKSSASEAKRSISPSKAFPMSSSSSLSLQQPYGSPVSSTPPAQASSSASLTQSQQTLSTPEPPEWLSQACHNLLLRFPLDRFEPRPRMLPVGSGPIEWRIRCVDCPGKLYTPGPGESLTNFEIHLKNRAHRAAVHKSTQLERRKPYGS